MGEKLTAKLGPLPVYAWGLIIGAIFVVFMYFGKRKGGTEDTEEATSQARTIDLNNFAPTSGIPNSGPGTIIEPEETTNAVWLAQSLALLMGRGISPIDGQVALMNYLNGLALTAEQQKLVNIALAKYGLPPQGVDAIPTKVPTATTPTTPAPGVTPTPAPAARYVTIEGDPDGGRIYRAETNGTFTPYTSATWSTFRSTATGAKVKVERLTGQTAKNALRATKNKRI